ncbi:MAG: extracellular solute-binding protein [Chloroflexi bacterium]|nr:extracellular solute-binding protein [Chloroflexota bacterium]
MGDDFLNRTKYNRRDLLKQGLQIGAALGVVGMGGLSVVGCGSESTSSAPTATSAPAAAATTAPAAATSAPSGGGEWVPSPKPRADRKYAWEPLAEGETAKSTGLQLRTIGLGVSVQDRFLREFERRTGHKATGKVTGLTPMITEWLAGGDKNYDTNETNANRNEALWVPGLLQPMPVEKVVPWKYARDTYTSESALGYDKNNGWPLAEVWADPKTQKEFKLVPQFYNCDSIGYRNDLTKEYIDSWGALVDPKYKGKSAIINDSLLTPGWCAGYMKYNKLADIKDSADMTKPEIDSVIDFLIGKKKEGQFRVIWEDYGQCVNLLASGEAWVTDAWNPVVEDVKKQGVSCYYAFPKEGYTAWFHGIAVRKGTENLDAVVDYFNFCLEGWWGAQVATQGYYSPTKTCDEYLKTYNRTSKEINDYDWWYKGGSSPEPKKEWPLTGRDGGSYEKRWGNIMHWMTWPKEADYYAKRWNDFLSA